MELNPESIKKKKKSHPLVLILEAVCFRNTFYTSWMLHLSMSHLLYLTCRRHGPVQPLLRLCLGANPGHQVPNNSTEQFPHPHPGSRV